MLGVKNLFRRDRRPRRPSLEHVLFSWSAGDHFTVRDACQSLAIVGKSGSGKSTGSGDHILRALVRYPNSAGLILASKPEDRDYVRRVFREERSENDLLIMEPGGEHRFNVLDYERKKGADTRELTQALMTFGETLERAESAGGGERDPFWASQNRRQLHNAIEIVTRATGGIDSWDLQTFIAGAALSVAETGEDKWKEGIHRRALVEAARNAKTDIERHDCELAANYWLYELPALNTRTRSSIYAGVIGLLHVFNTGGVRDLLATSTTISPDILEECKWWLVNMPIVPGDATATFVNTAVRYAVQRHILRRKASNDSPLIAIFCDEFQKISNSYDSAFLAEARSHKGCLVALTQSLHAMYANLHGKSGDHQTDALLTNFGHVVFHTVGDSKTAEYASSLLGKRRELFVSTSLAPADERMYDVLMGRAQVSVSCHESYEPVLQPSVFLSGLRCGGPPSRTVDGVVIRSGQPFRTTNENYLITSFKQR